LHSLMDHPLPQFAPGLRDIPDTRRRRPSSPPRRIRVNVWGEVPAQGATRHSMTLELKKAPRPKSGLTVRSMRRWHGKVIPYSDREFDLIRAFSILNDEGQQKAVEGVEIIAGNPHYRAQDTPQSSPAPQESTVPPPPQTTQKRPQGTNRGIKLGSPWPPSISEKGQEISVSLVNSQTSGILDNKTAPGATNTRGRL